MSDMMEQDFQSWGLRSFETMAERTGNGLNTPKPIFRDFPIVSTDIDTK